MTDIQIFSATALPDRPTSPDQLAGSNAGARTLTRAENDIEAVSSWLLSRTHRSANTFESYRREAQRLLAWCSERKLQLVDVLVEDITAYAAFIRDPKPLERWCVQQAPRFLEDGTQNPKWAAARPEPRLLKNGQPNPAWRPFISGLSDAAASQAMTVLFGLFEFLCGTGYLQSNPCRVARVTSRKSRVKTVERYLDSDTWQTLLAHVDAWPRKTFRQIAHQERTRFVLSFLYLTGLRRSEFAAASTADIRLEQGRFWLRVKGKGDVVADVPLPADALAALQRYRSSLGRSDMPAPEVREPLFMDVCGKGRHLTAAAVAHIITSAFESAANACSDLFQAQRLKAASAHWLRHTAATHQIEAGVPLLVVRDNLRHASVQTTERYLHQDRQVQHKETEKHRL